MAENLGNILKEVGGNQHALALINVLEKLCGIEEPSVREKVSFTHKTKLGEIGFRFGKIEGCLADIFLNNDYL